MKSFACGDVVPGCDARFLANTDEEILRQVGVHAHGVHGLVDVPDHVVVAVRQHISEVDRPGL